MTPECLSNRLNFLRNKYPLLTPFYAFSSYFVYSKVLQKNMRLTSEILIEINENVKFVRSQIKLSNGI